MKIKKLPFLNIFFSLKIDFTQKKKLKENQKNVEILKMKIKVFRNLHRWDIFDFYSK